MGTKLEPTFNLLATSANSKAFTVHSVNDWEYFQETKRLTQFYTFAMSGLDNFQEAVHKMLEKGDIESIKKTMQIHEDVFKNQVKELHRLYGVQKMLMEVQRKETKQNVLWGPMASSGTNHLQFNNRENSTTQTTGGLIFNLQSLRDDPSSRERSGSCSGDNMRMSRGFDLERPAEEVMSTGISTIDEDQAGPSTPIVSKSNKMSIDGCEEDSDVELTLSIGGILCSKKRSNSYPPFTQKDREIDSSVSFKSERGEECSDPTTPMSSSSATCDQETKRPHWLFQSLKLK